MCAISESFGTGMSPMDVNVFLENERRRRQEEERAREKARLEALGS
jgi:hypothetical protein